MKGIGELGIIGAAAAVANAVYHATGKRFRGLPITLGQGPFRMNEQSAIISAFELLCGEGKPAALATVVAVSGSAYRRPGARMLIAEDGRTWGGISGGCLERDVVRRSRGVLASGRPVLCRYETTDDEDLATGVATGCRGTVDLFIEPLSREAPGPIPWMIQASRGRQKVALATIVRTSGGSESERPGTRLSLDKAGPVDGQLTGLTVRDFCLEALADAGAGELPKLIQFHADDVTTDVFLEWLLPPQELVIFGAGPDAVPVVSIAKLMGWRVCVVGVRPATGLAQRFAHADVLHVTSTEDPVGGVEVTQDSAVVLMTHNYPRDIGILVALPVVPRYLGILGPRVRTEQLFADLGGSPTCLLGAALGNRGQASTIAHGTHGTHGTHSENSPGSVRSAPSLGTFSAAGALTGGATTPGSFPPVRAPAALDKFVGSVPRTVSCGMGETVRSADPTRTVSDLSGAENLDWQTTYAPIGLDLGAETPEEIALSIVAEIQAVLRSTPAGFLRNRDGPIHAISRDRGLFHRPDERVWREVACPM